MQRCFRLRGRRRDSQRERKRERERFYIMGGNDDASCGAMGDQECLLEWVSKYMGDCLCDTGDIVSFAVGLASVFCWGVAEVPQIITNFREGSTEGLSLLFLMTWVVGDIFNLIGCYLEPSTLSTQFYMALLYTITTIILVVQVIYYQHFLKWWKHRMVAAPAPVKPTQRIEAMPIPPQPSIAQPIAYAPTPPLSVQGRGRYYTSARSLASSHTPTAGSFLAGGSRGSGGRGSTHSFLQHNSLEECHASRPIPISISTSRSAPAPSDTHFSSPSILRAVASVAMCIGGLNIGRGFTLKHRSHTLLETPRVFSGRKLFQSAELKTEYHTLDEVSEGTIGLWLGWLMAAIYMGGRLPQIWLNIKRGSVEGLNPLMFTFALLGNVTYVGSILIRSTKWEIIKSNMPWLVDASVCVGLDCLILCQFIYYYARKWKDGNDDSGGDYKSLE